jgi:hypothetical protein
MKRFINKKNLYIEHKDHYEIRFSEESKYYMDGDKPRAILIDKCDLETVLPYNWCARPGKHTVYASASVKTETGFKTAIGMHNLLLDRLEIYGFEDDGKVIDHRDRNGGNNRRLNLRIAGLVSNQVNSNLPKNSTTGVKGVSYNISKDHWLVQFSFGTPRYQYTKTFTVSKFKNKEEAFKVACQYRKNLETYIGFNCTDADFDVEKAKALLDALKKHPDPVNHVKRSKSS